MYESQIPFYHTICRKGYGVATGVLLGHQNTDFERGGTDQVTGWVSMEAGGVPVEGGVEAAFKRDLEAIKDPAAREAEAKRIQLGIESLHDRFRTAEHYAIQELIDPRESRGLIEEWLEIVYRWDDALRIGQSIRICDLILCLLSSFTCPI